MYLTDSSVHGFLCSDDDITVRAVVWKLLIYQIISYILQFLVMTESCLQVMVHFALYLVE